MGTNEWLTLAAIMLGPIIAVSITLWIERGRRKRESRLIVLRQLVATRHLPGDPMYSTAVNLIPVEFNDDPRVMAAHKAYHEALRQSAAASNEQQHQALDFLVSRQTKMIFAIMQSLGLKASEADLPTEAYAASAMTERNELYLRSLQGTVRIADALERQTELVARAQAEVSPDATEPQSSPQ